MATSTQIQQLYLSYFGRPADAGGLSFYGSAPVSSILATFSASAESQALYGSSFGYSQINAIYHNLFNRDVETAGANYWIAVVQSGALSAAAAAYTMLQSAGNADLLAINYKLQVASTYTSLATNYSGNAAAAAARDLLATVSSTFDTVTAANTKITTTFKTTVPILPPGGSFLTLTTGVDHLQGTQADENISGSLGGSFATYNAGDSIDGGGGTDTLSLSVSGGSLSLAGVQVSNIEKLRLASSAASTVDAQSLSGVGELVLAGYGMTVNLANKMNVTVDDSGFYPPPNNSVFNVYVPNALLVGSADSVTLTVAGTSGTAQVKLASVTPTANEYEVVNIVSNGPASYYGNTTDNMVTLSTDATQTSLGTINISGGASLTLMLPAGDNIATSAVTINASAATGAVNIGGVSVGLGGGVPLGAANHHITLGSGNDTAYFGANLDAGDVVDGGSGSDTIVVTGAVSSMANVHNVESLRFDLSSQSIVQDASVAGMAGLQYIASGSNTLTLNNLANNAAITMQTSIAGLAASLQNSSGSSDSLTVVMGLPSYGGPLSLGVLSGFAGVERLNFVANVGGTYSGGTSTINSINSSAPIFFSGNGTLRVNSALQTQSVDAFAMTGNLNVTLGTSATTYRGGSGTDTILVGLGSNGHTLGHTITTGAGADNIVFTNEDTAGNGGATSLAGMPDITDFSAGQDKLGMYYYNSSYPLGYSIHPAGTSGMQSVAQNGTASLSNTSDAVMVKLSTGVAFSGTIAGTFAAAIGTGSVTHTGGTYMAMAYDTTHSKAIVALVSSYTGGTGDLTAADFTSAGVSVLGVLDMNALDYAALSAANFSGNMYT